MNKQKLNIIILFLCLLSVYTRVSSSEIIPAPVSMITAKGHYSLSPTTVIVATDSSTLPLAKYLNEYLSPAVGLNLLINTSHVAANAVVLSIQPHLNLPAEGYRLTVTPSGIDILSKDRAGIFNGIQTLLQLMPETVYTKKQGHASLQIPCVQIEDYPRFSYRGMMLDVVRTFVPVEQVKMHIDWLSHHKINKFHWHLTDDEGWRIELKSYPKLAQIGGFRGGDSPVKAIYGEWTRKYGGYYTQQEIREVVEFARFRNIEVIPEIELPGHSRAIARVYPQILCRGPVDSTAAGYDRRNVWCVSKESNYEMLEAILAEICDLFPSKYIHIGGDEVDASQWKKCPDCRQLMYGKHPSADQIAEHFTERIDKMLHAHGKCMSVWNESVRSGRLTPNGKHVYGWENVDVCRKATQKQYHTIVMPGTYFYLDMKEAPSEPGLTWAGVTNAERTYSFRFSNQGFSDEQMKYVEGVEGVFWSEMGLSNPDGYIEYQLYPQVCALAEVGWSPEKTRLWSDFKKRLTQKHLARLAAMGVRFRMFPPEVSYHRGIISVTNPLSNATIRYTTDGKDPDTSSQVYTQPIKDTVPEKYMFRAFYQNRVSGIVAPSVHREIQIDSAASATVTFPLKEVVDRHGIWYMSFPLPCDNVTITRMEVTSPDTTYTIIRRGWKINPFHQMRLHIDSRNQNGQLSITLKNNDPRPCRLLFELSPSPYIEPKATLTSTLPQNPRFPFSNAVDYNVTSYVRTRGTCQSGDSFTFTFKEPTACQSIEVITGLRYLPRYHIVSGYVEISSDGKNFQKADTLSAGQATIYPKRPVKVLRIVSTCDGNGENAVAIQDLRIKPARP